MKPLSTILTALLIAATAWAEPAPAARDSEEPTEASAAAPAPRLCEVDKTLRAVATDLAKGQDIPPPPQLVRAVREAGADANPVYAKFGVTGEPETFRAWLIDIKAKADGPLVCGRGRSGDRVVLIAAVQAGRLTMVSRESVRAEVISTFRDPFLVVRSNDQPARRIPIGAEGRAPIAIPNDWGRPLFVQLLATGPSGPRPVAERWVGRIPKGPSSRPTAETPAAWLHQLRRASGSRSLRSNRLLSREAATHAQTVCESGRVGHELNPHADPEARLLRQGVEARVVGEAVARARTLSEALYAIEDSPSHRMTVTDPRFTDVGYGTSKDDRDRTCVVVLLAAWPRHVP